MGSDGYIYITNPKDILLFVRLIIIHSIKEKYCDENDEITFNEDEQYITTYEVDPEIPGEKIVVDTTPLEPYYWDIYTYLVNEFNTDLDQGKIPEYAWDILNEMDSSDDDTESETTDEEDVKEEKFNWRKEFERNFDEVENNHMNWHYGDNTYDSGGWVESIYSFFSYGCSEQLTNIYNDTIKSEKKCDWYETFIESFPTVDEFINILREYKDVVKIEEIHMWT